MAIQKKHTHAQRSPMPVLAAIRAALNGCILTVVLVILLACTLRWQWVDINAIRISNTIIKILSAFAAGGFAMRYLCGKRVLVSGVAGTLYIGLSYVIFCLIEQSFAVTLRLLSDVLLCFSSGLAAGVFYNAMTAFSAQRKAAR